MKKGSTIFLQVVIVLIGIASLAFMLWEPHLEGRNAHAIITFGSVVIVTAAAVFERLLQNVVDIKSENDLTV